MTDFRLAPHDLADRNVVEVWEDGQMIAIIYPKDRGVKVVSKYLDGGRSDLVAVDPAFPPALHVNVWRGTGKASA